MTPILDNPAIFDQPKPWPKSSHADNFIRDAKKMGCRCAEGEIAVFVPCEYKHSTILLDADETERFLDILKSYREEPEKWGGITEITDDARGGLEFVVNADGAFIRLFNRASAHITEKELNEIIDRIEFTTCEHCNQKIERVALLRLFEERRRRFKENGGWDIYDD